jgi:hypothetical protein
VRRVGVVLLVALAAAAGCATRPDVVPGNAAPITGSPGPAAGTQTPAPTPAPTGSPLPVVPADFRALTMTGFGVSVTLPVPADWARTPSTSSGLDRTDVGLRTPQVLLRVDLSARGEGSAEAGVLRNESAARLAGYRRLGIAPVPGVGDDAVDWTFTFQRDGARQVVDRQVLSGPAVVAVYYSAPQDLYERYLPVWHQAVRGLAITTS